MFQKQHLILVFLALIALAAGQSRMFGNKKHPTLEGYCYDDEHKVDVKVGEWVYPTGFDYQCFRLHCREDFVLTAEHCPRGTPTCDKPDFSKPYPECCSTCNQA